jgi:hypothetical protein
MNKITKLRTPIFLTHVTERLVPKIADLLKNGTFDVYDLVHGFKDPGDWTDQTIYIDFVSDDISYSLSESPSQDAQVVSMAGPGSIRRFKKALAAKPKAVAWVNGGPVIFHKEGTISVGCQDIPFEVLEFIYKKAKKAKKAKSKK